MIEPRIETLKQKKLIGLSMEMSIINNKTGQLWGTFVPRIKEISNVIGNDKYSVQFYSNDHFINFSPANEFTKWAAIEVHRFDTIPGDMKSLILSEGLYAVFDYKGSSQDSSVFQYIYGEWLPKSSYQLDDRAHFEVLGDKYKNNDPSSEEEIWIPIKRG